MKIERIDDKTVKCFISNEEMEEYEITYKDFVIRSDRAREVVEEIIEQAEEEVGYQPPKFAFDLQIMVLPEKGMVLTFSEKDSEEDKIPDADGNQMLMDCLKEMKEILLEKKKQLSEEASTLGKKKQEKPNFAVFAFENLRDVMSYAEALPTNLRIQSSLYEMNGSYYLYINKASAAYKRYSRACIQAMEFGQLYAAELQKVSYLWEHANCLIAENAVKKLRKVLNKEESKGIKKGNKQIKEENKEVKEKNREVKEEDREIKEENREMKEEIKR